MDLCKGKLWQSECFLFQSFEVGRELGGGSLSRPKATSGVRAGRESELRRDNETGDAETWVAKSKQSCLDGEKQANIQKDEEKQQPKSALLFLLCYKGMLKIPSLRLDPKYSEVNGISVGLGSGPLKEGQL